MDYFARAVRLAELDDHRVALAIAHNPYATSTHAAREISRSFDREEQGLVRGRTVERGGVRLGDLYSAFGPARREQVSRDVWERQRAERVAARERTRQMVEERERNGGK